MKWLGFIIIPLVCLGADIRAQATEDSWDLARCLQYAATNNITVKQSELNRETAETNYIQSRWGRLPNLTASGSQSLTHGTSADPITYEFISQTIHSTSLSLNSQITLYNGNKIGNTIHQNKLLVDQNSFYVEQAKNNITLSMVQAFLQACYYREGVVIAENNVQASAKQVERSQALFDAGSVAAKDLADIKSQYATDQYSLVTAKNLLQQQVLALKQLLELDPNEPFNIAFPSVEDSGLLVIPDKYDVYSIALKQMPEIRANQLQREISELNVRIARAGYQPSLTLNGALTTGYTNTQGTTFSEQFDNNYNQRASVSINIPIFNQFKTKANVQNAQIGIRSAELDLISAKKELYKNIENAHQSAIAAQAEMAAANVQVEATKTAYDLAKQQYDVGLLNSVDLLIDQNDYITAQQKFVQARYTTLLYYQLLQFYQGNEIKL